MFSHDVTAAILVSQNYETAAMLVSQTSPLGVELFSYADAFFCYNRFAYILSTWVKTLYISSGENLLKNQLDSSCVIMSLILVTTLFYKAVILQGEIWCWSLLGLKGLKSTSERKWRRRAGSFRQISKIIVLLNKVFSSGFSSGPGCSKLG